MKAFTWISWFLVSYNALAAPLVQGIPRVSTQHYVREGLFEGGDAKSANLEDLRFSPHPGGVERWVLDFSDPKGRSVGEAAPRFQLRYEKPAEGSPQPPRFVISMRGIESSHIKLEKLRSLPSKSRYVKEILLYPPVEEGDRVLEFVLNADVRFETFQPLEKSGRLVLDLTAAP